MKLVNLAIDGNVTCSFQIHGKNRNSTEIKEYYCVLPTIYQQNLKRKWMEFDNVVGDVAGVNFSTI